MTVNEMKARKMGYWPHMCVGGAHLIVPSTVLPRLITLIHGHTETIGDIKGCLKHG